ncbi:MAG: protein translocase SEC61 complex subunit gamma [Methanocellales archaeon]
MRILRLTRKPTLEEFTMIAKIAALGLLVIGLVGFAIYLIMVTIPELLMRR